MLHRGHLTLIDNVVRLSSPTQFIYTSLNHSVTRSLVKVTGLLSMVTVGRHICLKHSLSQHMWVVYYKKGRRSKVTGEYWSLQHLLQDWYMQEWIWSWKSMVGGPPIKLSILFAPNIIFRIGSCICWLPNRQISVTGNAPYSTGMGIRTSNVRCPSW